MSALSLDDFKNIVDSIKEVEIDEWYGKSVFMKPLSAKRQQEIICKEAELAKNPDRRNMAVIRKMLLQGVICDEQGNLLFDDKTIDVLMESNAKVVQQLFDVAIEDNFPKSEKIEEIAKN